MSYAENALSSVLVINYTSVSLTNGNNKANATRQHLYLVIRELRYCRLTGRRLWNADYSMQTLTDRLSSALHSWPVRLAASSDPLPAPAPSVAVRAHQPTAEEDLDGGAVSRGAGHDPLPLPLPQQQQLPPGARLQQQPVSAPRADTVTGGG